MKHSIIGILHTRIDFRFARKNLLASEGLSEKEKDWLGKVSLPIHPNDDLYSIRIHSTAHHYLSVGLSAIRGIDDSLAKMKVKPNVRKILDFPCGYGRVLRFLRTRFPGAEVSGAEIDTAALDFCEREFSIKPISSNADFANLSIPGNFDLIWCGSLITHIEEWKAAALLKLFHAHLSPGGLCVFTTHGHLSAEWIKNKKMVYGLTEMGQREILSQFHEKGYGYADYGHQRGYGISLVSPERMRTIAHGAGRWNEVSFLEHAWDNHQDIYGFSVPG